MSGDVQPRKRKDKKKKKDEPLLEESHGTAAVLGEGDVFIHSHSEHGTGGHWCAKIIFFSLLAILITLIGLIIIETRGLSELEANAVESRYSGILEGWIEDAPDDDHHDIHTLELKHHDEEPEEEDDHDDGFEDGGSEEDDDSILDPNEDEEDSQELDTAATEEVGFNHHEDEDENEDVDAEEESVEEVAAETPVESYFDYFFGSEKPQKDVLSEEDEDDKIDFEDPGNDNDSYENDLGDVADSNDIDDEDDETDNDEYENTDENDFAYQEKESNYDKENDNSVQSNYDDDEDEYQHQHDNDASTYHQDNTYETEDNNNDWEINEKDENDLEAQYVSNYDQNFNENINQEENDDDHDDEDDEESEEVEVEKIEEEVDDQEPIDIELPPLPEEDADSADEKDDDEDSNANDDDDDNDGDDDDDDDDKDDDDDDDDFLEHDDIFEEPIVERITVPAGKPYVEMDDDDSAEQVPVNTLAEEEEYERRQEELRKEEAEASHVWLKLGVGAALLVATHAVIKRATSRDDVNSEESEDREDTPSTTDRRMTLISEATTDDLEIQEAPISRLERQVFQQIPHIVKSAPTPLQVSMDDENTEIEEDYEQQTQEEEEELIVRTKTPEVELYSDEEIEENIIEPIKETLVINVLKKHAEPDEEKEPASDEDIDEEEEDDDVEIIGDEQIEEEEVEELDDEDISDVDDAELLSRLEAKYGSLSDPEKAPTKHKDGGNSVDDAWPGEPADPFWKKEVDKAEDELEQGQWSAAIGRALSPQLAKSSRALYIAARAYDHLAEEKRDNKILSIAINAYVELLKKSDRISDKKLLEITNRTIERMHFRGTYLSTEPIHRLLIRRFPDNVGYRNNFTISFLMANRADLAEEVLKETLKKWPNDRVALAHYGFILKTQHNRLEDSLKYLTKALENDTGPATEPRFYYHLGDTLLLLGRFDEAHEVHKRAAKHGHFLSPSQRSLYNVERLKGKPWWNVNETPYERLAKSLEQNWRAILKEGLAAKALYEEENEGLREKGEWSQLDLFVRGFEVGGRCSRAPITCAAVRAEPAAVGCRRGQVKFSAIEPGTHVRPHVGPTNCRLRMHLGLSNTKDTYLRVDKETRQWQEGKVFIFDDSFEHEVWHNGTGSRLVLIVDVWHPDLTPQERKTLPAI